MNMSTRSDTPEILYEDDHILVCVKPHGTATQSRQIGRPDMVSLLKNHISQNTASRDEPYLAVIHRLDQPVRGILVFAKSPFAAKELNRQLQQQDFGKYYRALTDGIPPWPEGTLEDYMAKDPRANLSRICSPDTAGAKLARLHYSVVRDGHRLFGTGVSKSTIDCAETASGTTSPDGPCVPETSTELEIRLDTGRHHQIRVQLAHLGCPIVGDTKYNPRCRDTSEVSSSWQTICLCAYRLDFCHPRTRKKLHFQL